MSARTGWRYTLDISDVWSDDCITFEQRRDEIVRRIMAASFYDEHVDEFDGFWSDFYDWCDAGRNVWVNLWEAGRVG